MSKSNTHGGARPNSGRKPKADEIAQIELMDSVMIPIEVWQALANKVYEGDTQAIKTWLEYRYGKPKQNVDVTSAGEKMLIPISTWAKE
jgi:hypothetical protein